MKINGKVTIKDDNISLHRFHMQAMNSLYNVTNVLLQYHTTNDADNSFLNIYFLYCMMHAHYFVHERVDYPQENTKFR